MRDMILLDGINILDQDPVLVRRQVGMIVQKANAFPTMSIFENVAAGLLLNGLRNERLLVEIVEESLRQAALWEEAKDSLDKSSTALSVGQQQRLCIARSLAAHPEVILMDEPSSALDPISTRRLKN